MSTNRQTLWIDARLGFFLVYKTYANYSILRSYVTISGIVYVLRTCRLHSFSFQLKSFKSKGPSRSSCACGVITLMTNESGSHLNCGKTNLFLNKEVFSCFEIDFNELPWYDNNIFDYKFT